MVSCHLSQYQFYLVASSYDRGAVFFLLHEQLNSDGTFSEFSDFSVKGYIRSVPVLVDHDRLRLDDSNSVPTIYEYNKSRIEA